MPKDICPRCLQVILSLWGEREIKCPVCETVFGTNNTNDDVDEK